MSIGTTGQPVHGAPVTGVADSVSVEIFTHGGQNEASGWSRQCSE